MPVGLKVPIMYHGWGYGHGLHLTVNSFRFPESARVETGSVSESEVFEEKRASLLAFAPKELVGDEAYTHLNIELPPEPQQEWL